MPQTATQQWGGSSARGQSWAWRRAMGARCLLFRVPPWTRRSALQQSWLETVVIRVQLKPMGSVCAQSCPTLCNPLDCSPPGSSVHGVSQARIQEWVAISSSRGSSQPRDQTCISCLLHWQVDSWPLSHPGVRFASEPNRWVTGQVMLKEHSTALIMAQTDAALYSRFTNRGPPSHYVTIPNPWEIQTCRTSTPSILPSPPPRFMLQIKARRGSISITGKTAHKWWWK